MYDHTLIYHCSVWLQSRQREIQGSKVRVIWGYVAFLLQSTHILLSFARYPATTFRSNLPPAFGASVYNISAYCLLQVLKTRYYQMLYLSNI